jgi:hypothetical protein
MTYIKVITNILYFLICFSTLQFFGNFIAEAILGRYLSEERLLLIALIN